MKKTIIFLLFALAVNIVAYAQGHCEYTSSLILRSVTYFPILYVQT